MSAEIPMSGYVSGQSVEISIRIDNETSKEVLVTQVFLVQIITSYSPTPKYSNKERQEILAEIHQAGVPKKSKSNIEATLLLPSVAPTTIDFSQTLKVSYEIHISAYIGANHRSPLLRLPLFIGKVPFRNNFNHHSLIPTIPFPAWSIQQPSTSNAQPMDLGSQDLRKKYFFNPTIFLLILHSIQLHHLITKLLNRYQQKLTMTAQAKNLSLQCTRCSTSMIQLQL